jgi:ParB family chromosome partitioning protein
MSKTVKTLKMASIIPGKYANRLNSEDPDLAALAESIRELGLQNPIVVAPEGDGFVVVSGHRRYAAMKLTGKSDVECFVEERDDDVKRKIVIAENSLRADLTSIEDAEQIRRWIQDDGLSTAEVSQIHHKSEDWVKRQLALLQWPMDVLEQIHVGTISVSAGANLAQITDDIYRGYLVRNASENGASARMTSAWLQGWRSALPPQEAVEMEGESSGHVPYAPAAECPCMVCGTTQPPERLSHVMICPGCVGAIQGAPR